MQRAHAHAQPRVAGADQHDRRVHRDARQRDDAVEREQAQRGVGDQQAEDHAGERHRHGDQDHQRLEVAAELGAEDQVDQPNAEHEQHRDGVQALLDIVEFPGEVEVDAGVALPDLLPVHLDAPVGLAGVDRELVDVGLDGDRAAEVVVLDAAHRAAVARLQQATQRHLATVGEHHALAQHAVDVAAAVGLRTDPHLDLRALVLQARDHLAVAGETHQPGHLARVEAAAAHRVEIVGERQLAPPLAVVVGDVENRRLGRHERLEIGNRGADRGEIVPAHLDLDRPRGRRAARDAQEGDVLRPRHGQNVITRGGDHLVDRAQVVGTRVQADEQLPPVVADQRFGLGEHQAGVANHLAHLAGAHMTANTPLDRLDTLEGLVQRGPGRHLDVHVEQPHRVEGEELEADHAGAERREGSRHEQQHQAQRQAGPAQHPDQHPRVADADPVDRPGARPLHAARAFEVDVESMHVRRQHPVRLEQADRERGGHHQRHHEHELADDAGHQHQRRERRHRGQHRGGDRCEDLVQRVERRRDHLLATRHAVVDRLDHDNGVVDDHAEADHHTEQHHDVERHADRAEHPEGAGQRERDADTGQQRDA